MQVQLKKPSYTTGEIAKICQVSKRTVILWIDGGKINGYRIPGSRHRRVSATELRRFLRTSHLPDFEGVARPRLLIVDDDRDFLELLKDALRDSYDIEVAESALEGASRLALFKPDAVLLDIRLPDISGLEACRHFRSFQKTRKLPILTVSAYGRQIDPDEVKKSGADGFLAKPLKLAELRKRIESMVG